jgi:hypothetical protein
VASTIEGEKLATLAMLATLPYNNNYKTLSRKVGKMAKFTPSVTWPHPIRGDELRALRKLRADQPPIRISKRSGSIILSSMPDNFVEIHRTQIIPRRHETMYLRLTNCLYKLKTAGCSLTGQTLQIYFAAPRHMWTAFSVARCPRIFPFKCRRNTTWQ